MTAIPVPDHRKGSPLNDIWVIAKRGLVHMRRQPEALSDATFLLGLTGLVWLLSGQSLLTYALFAQAALSCLLAAALWTLRRAAWPR